MKDFLKVALCTVLAACGWPDATAPTTGTVITGTSPAGVAGIVCSEKTLEGVTKAGPHKPDTSVTSLPGAGYSECEGPGYKKSRGPNYVVEAGKTTTTTVPLEQVAPPIDSAATTRFVGTPGMRVDSVIVRPLGATSSVRVIGQSASTFVDSAKGDARTLREYWLSKQGHVSQPIGVVLKPGENAVVTVILLPSPPSGGIVWVMSTISGARLDSIVSYKRDGTRTLDRKQDALSLVPRNYSVSSDSTLHLFWFSAPGHVSEPFQASPMPGEVETIRAELKPVPLVPPTTGRLLVASFPRNMRGVVRRSTSSATVAEGTTNFEVVVPADSYTADCTDPQGQYVSTGGATSVPAGGHGVIFCTMVLPPPPPPPLPMGTVTVSCGIPGIRATVRRVGDATGNVTAVGTFPTVLSPTVAGTYEALFEDTNGEANGNYAPYAESGQVANGVSANLSCKNQLIPPPPPPPPPPPSCTQDVVSLEFWKTSVTPSRPRSQFVGALDETFGFTGSYQNPVNVWVLVYLTPEKNESFHVSFESGNESTGGTWLDTGMASGWTWVNAGNAMIRSGAMYRAFLIHGGSVGISGSNQSKWSPEIKAEGVRFIRTFCP